MCAVLPTFPFARETGRLFVPGMFFVMLAVLGLFSIPIVGGKIALYRDRIVINSWGSVAMLRLEEIAFRRYVMIPKNRGMEMMVGGIALIPSDAHKKPIYIGVMWLSDSVMQRWLEQIPTEHGTPDEWPTARQVGVYPMREGEAQHDEHIDSVELLTNTLVGLFYAVIYDCVAIWPNVRWLNLVVVAGPFCAFALAFLKRDTFALYNCGESSRPRRAVPWALFLMPAPLYYVLTYPSEHLTFSNSWETVIKLGLLGGTVLTGLIWLCTRDAKMRMGVFAGLFILLSLDFGGALCVLDLDFDQAQGSIFRTQVALKPSRRESPSRVLLLSHGADYYEVSDKFYNNLDVGDPICIVSHPGALGIKWQNLTVCSKP
jgi:hypothetical protein